MMPRSPRPPTCDMSFEIMALAMGPVLTVRQAHAAGGDAHGTVDPDDGAGRFHVIDVLGDMDFGLAARPDFLMPAAVAVVGDTVLGIDDAVMVADFDIVVVEVLKAGLVRGFDAHDDVGADRPVLEGADIQRH